MQNFYRYIIKTVNSCEIHIFLQKKKTEGFDELIFVNLFHLYFFILKKLKYSFVAVL